MNQHDLLGGHKNNRALRHGRGWTHNDKDELFKWDERARLVNHKHLSSCRRLIPRFYIPVL